MELSAVARMLKRTEVLKEPKRRLATFGATNIGYRLVSPVEDLLDRTRIREGRVVSERPKIVTAELLKERFEGFDDESKAFGDWLLDAYGDKMRTLEYRFKNESGLVQVIRSPQEQAAAKIKKSIENSEDIAILLCPDAGWQVALMKFLIDQCRRSFGSNVRDLEAKGMFRTPAERKRDEIEGLLRRAKDDRSLIGFLGEKLKEYGLFSDYEDRFFNLL